jgi:cytoskeletal protein RodZ
MGDKDCAARMESFGTYLRQLREESGKSLEDIASSTKIAASNLEFLEKDRYDLLPPRVFVKGFIRSYVQELGMNADETIKRFDEFTSEGELPDYAQEDHPVFNHQPRPASFISSRWFTVVLTAAGLISICILILTGVSRLIAPSSKTNGAQPRVVTAQPQGLSSSQARIATDELHEEPALAGPSEGQEGKKILEIKAVANTWIRVEPDVGPAEELTMAPGDIQIFTAKQHFTLQTANAGGIKLRFDGKELPPLGKLNQALSLTLP